MNFMNYQYNYNNQWYSLSPYININVIILIILFIGILFLLVEGSIRSMFGFIIISCIINVYLIINGYLIIALLCMISIISVSIIISILKYNTYNIHKVEINNKFIYLFGIYISYFIFNSIQITSLSFNNINNIEIIGLLCIFNSTFYYIFFIICLFMFSYLIIRFNYNINIDFGLCYFNIVSYFILDIYLLIIVAIAICYIPIIIRYKSSIYKWSSDIYEVGVGINMANSHFNNISNNNIGNYTIYIYIYFFLFLDIIIHYLLIIFIFNINTFSFILFISTLLITLNIILSNINSPLY